MRPAFDGGLIMLKIGDITHRRRPARTIPLGIGGLFGSPGIFGSQRIPHFFRCGGTLVRGWDRTGKVARYYWDQGAGFGRRNQGKSGSHCIRNMGQISHP